MSRTGNAELSIKAAEDESSVRPVFFCAWESMNLNTLDPRQPLAVLAPNNNIQVRDIVQNIDVFVWWNLAATFTRKLHYEHDSYGAINDYLHAIFPPSRRFSITPQSLLRVAVPAPDLSDTHSSQATSTGSDDEVFDEAANTSLGAYGAYHRSRHNAGQEPGKKYFDFTASKVSVTSVSVPEHTLLTFVEVKRDGESDWITHNQMSEYMELVPNRDPQFRAFMLNVEEHKFVEYFFESTTKIWETLKQVVRWEKDEHCRVHANHTR
ncbi:hypothetical protein CPB85DRAFT_1458230 [Mucidula mucida]|nr:hypothetical protein CPB85DRAFT_1458230 [Mucidula mucida]